MVSAVFPLEKISVEAQKVLRHLARSGHKAYLVGGCVRDLLLGRTPKDFDVATDATPAELREMFRNCRIIGKRFRLAHIVFGETIIETATFRANPRQEEDDDANPISGEESDELYIHRDNVFGTAEQDARRRDFTVNGLFYDLPEQKVIDHVDGLRDLDARLIRTIGDPNVRFREDPVRMLRAVKFAARLGFDIEDETWAAMCEHGPDLKKSPPPRVLEEIYRMLRGGAAVESMMLLRESRQLVSLLPTLYQELQHEPDVLTPYLDELDRRVKNGQTLQNALLLCVLRLPRLFPLFVQLDRNGAAAASLIEDAFAPLAEMKVPRREWEQAKMLLLFQRRILQTRLRGNKLSDNLLASSDFHLAFLLHTLVYQVVRQSEGLSAEAIGQEIRAWPYAKTLFSSLAEPPPSRAARRRGSPSRSPSPRRSRSFARFELSDSDEPETAAPEPFTPRSEPELSGAEADAEEAALAAFVAAMQRKHHD
jgi:poly(A) polymerase